MENIIYGYKVDDQTHCSQCAGIRYMACLTALSEAGRIVNLSDQTRINRQGDTVTLGVDVDTERCVVCRKTLQTAKNERKDR